MMFKDVINVTTPGFEMVDHVISYFLPSNAQQLRTSDYILIDMPGFTDIQPPVIVQGAYGIPHYSIIGTRIRITNVAQLPGTTVDILGIKATNPSTEDGFLITLSIAEDGLGATIRNQAFTTAGNGNAYIGITASIESPLSSLSISGYTAPASFVILSEEGTTVGTTQADGSGNFTFSITGLDPGPRNYRISATDTLERPTAGTTLTLTLLEHTLTTVTGIILSSTLQLSSQTIHPGDLLTISGAAKPGTQINIFVESPLRSYSAVNPVSGDWTYDLTGTETQSYIPGQYRVYTIVQDDIGNQSVVSNTLTFTVVTNEDSNPEPACDISHGDLNCDGKTNLVDFSILLFHWKTNHKKADINRSGMVDLVDFSIMMFYFRR